MKYANLNFKKVTGMSLIVATLAVSVALTAAIWARQLGTFSIPNVELTMANAISMWQYRLQFNSEFGTKAPPGLTGLLATIGLAPPAIPQASAATSGTIQSIPVILYHGLAPTSDEPEVTSVGTFRSQMFALKNAGWQTVSVEDFAAAMQGKKVLPPKSFLLTFDDGRQDAYLNATPILQALDYQAVMHVITGRSLVTGNLKSSYYATKDQLRQMLASGVWELGSHGDIAHVQYPVDGSGKLGDFFGMELWIPTQDAGESSSSYQARIADDLNQYWLHGTTWPLSPGRNETLAEYESRIVTDLANAKNDLQNQLGVNAISFAYPYNDFAQDLKSDSLNGTPGLVNFANQIYPISFYQWYPSLGFSENYPGVDGQLLKRIEPRPNWTAEDLLAVINEGQAKSLPYSLGSNGNDGWTEAWGNVSSSGGMIALSAKPTTSGAYTILDGSRWWGNYDYEIQFNWQNAASVSLYGHYQADPRKISYVACNFGKGSVRIEDHEGGAVAILAHASDPSISPGNGKNIGLHLTGNYAECSWNGGVVVAASLPHGAPSIGGVGMEVWNPQLGTAQATVTGVSVK